MALGSKGRIQDQPSPETNLSCRSDRLTRRGYHNRDDVDDATFYPSPSEDHRKATDHEQDQVTIPEPSPIDPTTFTDYEVDASLETVVKGYPHPSLPQTQLPGTITIWMDMPFVSLMHTVSTS